MKGVNDGKRPELVGGGLIRSLGGWSAVKALRGMSERIKGDERILGDGSFVGGEQSGKRSRGAAQKSIVAVAVERKERKLGRLRLQVIQDRCL
jgi:hypothetical protein